MALLGGVSICNAASKTPPTVPDLTQGGVKDDKHDWNLGPTGARGWMWGWKLETTNSRQILITEVDKGSPADGVLEVGDVILGMNGKPFSEDARKSFGRAITEAETPENKGVLKLLRWREGETDNATLQLRVMGRYSDTAPFDCAKSRKILEEGCRHIAKNMKGSIQGTVNTLALLASGNEEYSDLVRDYARKIGKPDLKLKLYSNIGLVSWSWGYNNLLLTEYYLATGDAYVLPAIEEYSVTIAQGQSQVGTWGHGMAWPEPNGGKLHGPLGGYGAMNQPSLILHMSLVLAKKCGVRHEEIDMALGKADTFFNFYINKGAIPYGDHRPGWQVHDDNGKDSSAAIVFDLQGNREGTRFFSKMTAASYGERERGHTGNYFSFLWGPLGANRAGPAAAAAFLKERRWFYDLGRRWDGAFIYQGGAGMGGGEHQYGGWDCTGVFILPCALPLKKLYITGKGTSKENEVTGRELEEVIEAGRGFSSWDMGLETYYGKSADELLARLRSWSPAVRHRAAEALAEKEGDVVPQLIRMLGDDDLTARYGACRALAALKAKGAPAVPALTELLGHRDVWLRIQACYSLAGIGEPARKAVPEMLKLAVREDPDDPRQLTQRFLAFTLFYPGGALGGRGLLARSLDGVDRQLLYPAVEILLRNDDGRARSATGSVYKNLTLDELAPILPAIIRAVEEQSPSGVMFASGIRLQGLALLAKHRIKEGVPLCLKVMDIDKWGKKNRITGCLKTLQSYGPGAAKSILPELRALEKDLLNHKEAKGNLSDPIILLQKIIDEAEATDEKPQLRSMDQITVAAENLAYIPIDRSGGWEASLNGEWRFMLNGPEADFFKPDFDASGWSAIQVPGNWETQGFEEPLYKEPREGAGLYRRTFEAPEAWEGRRVFIRFEGVLLGFEFWVNGKRAGSFESAFNRSEFDVTDLVELGKSNTLAVRVYRRFKGWQFDTNDAWGISGIYRDVSLFAVPDTHIKDLTIVTDLNPDLSEAHVSFKISIDRFSTEGPQDALLRAVLVPPVGGMETHGSGAALQLKRGEPMLVSHSFKLQKPLLWNAETPNLYELRLELLRDGKVLHKVNRKVGIREVSIDGDVFKLNGRPVKMRGVNHHDIHPDAGRAMREEHYREDVELMKKANINAVRTSHYPPHPVFLDLCDRYGIYVVCEVPFGFGDKNLSDASYGDILLARAEATVARDKNHPSILIWSVGNENPITPLVVKTADRVKELDPTRFRLLPGAQDSKGKTPMKGENLTEFAEKTKFIFNLPESVEIAAPHYPYVVEIAERERKINLTDLALDTSIKRPVICTEYNHSLGTAFEGLKEHWDTIEKYDRLGGAFIWNWADQGLRRKTAGREVLTNTEKRLLVGSKDTAVSADVWLDAETVLDSHGGSGSDGIVYADRFPQVDYWITRKVYSQVVIPEDRVVVRPGKQKIELAILNRFDFIGLEKLKGKWEFLRDGKQVDSGDVSVSAPPRGKGKIAVEVDLKDDVEITENLLRFAFTDSHGRQIYERSVRLVPKSGKIDFPKRLALSATASSLQSTPEREGVSSYQFGNLLVRLDRAKGKVNLINAASGTSLLEGPIVRVGRPPVMAEYRNYPRYEIKFWENALLRNGKVLEFELSQTPNGGVKINMQIEYPSLDEGRKEESILANLTLNISPKGWVDIDYELTPQNATGNFLDFGLAFKMPKAMNRLTWVGDGPYNSYPGQTDAAERGVWRIAPKPATDPESRTYAGNRANVDLAAATDEKGNGIGVICDGSTISIEETKKGVVFSQVLRSSGKGNKTGGMLTLLPVKADEVKSEKGSMRVVPLEGGKWPALFEELLGPVFEK